MWARESGCYWNVERIELLLLSILGCLVRTLFCGLHLQWGSSNWSSETRFSSLEGNAMYIRDSYTNSLAEFKVLAERCARKCFLTFNARHCNEDVNSPSLQNIWRSSTGTQRGTALQKCSCCSWFGFRQASPAWFVLRDVGCLLHRLSDAFTLIKNKNKTCKYRMGVTIHI